MEKNERLISLDAFRGFTIASMLVVNNPGTWSHVYAPLRHAEWNGLTPTDLVFPFFVFIVGVSIALAYSKHLQAGVSKKQIYRKIVIRTVSIFLCGIFLWLNPKFDFSNLRIVGVLQRIAIVFFFCSLLFLNTKWKTQALIGAVILVGYWLAMTLIPTPGYDKPMLEPGINLAAWVDTNFCPGKLWQKTWDPEGILSTFPAIVTGITGMLAGHLLLSSESRERKVIYLFSYGFFAAVTGYFWNQVFPVNKSIWTSSFVMVTSGLAAMVLAASYFFVDMQGRRRFTKPGIVFGANAIAIYVLADFLGQIFYFIKFGGASLNRYFVDFCISVGMEPKLASFIYPLLYVSISYIPAWLLYRNRIFIKL